MCLGAVWFKLLYERLSSQAFIFERPICWSGFCSPCWVIDTVCRLVIFSKANETITRHFNISTMAIWSWAKMVCKVVACQILMSIERVTRCSNIDKWVCMVVLFWWEFFIEYKIFCPFWLCCAQQSDNFVLIYVLPKLSRWYSTVCIQGAGWSFRDQVKVMLYQY